MIRLVLFSLCLAFPAMAQTNVAVDSVVGDARTTDAEPDSELSDAEVDTLGALATTTPTEDHGTAVSVDNHGASLHGEEAAHGGHAGINFKSLLLQILNFSVLLFILIKFGGSAMGKFLHGRHEQIKKNVHDAAELWEQAKQKSEQQGLRLASLEKEIAALRESIQANAAQEQARLVASAQEKARRVQEDTRLQLEQQVKSAEARLRADVAAASMKLAEELLKRNLGPDDDRRLAREFVTSFEAVPVAGRRAP